MNKKLLLILGTFFLFGVLLMSNVSAQLTQQFSSDPQLAAYVSNGYVISPVVAADSQLNADFHINFRVYDDNGKVVPVSSTSVNCSAFLFSPNENRVYRFDGNGAMTNISLTGRLATVPASFMNKTGTYHWYVACEDNTVGGAMQGIVEITPNGENSANNLILYLLIIGTLLSLTLIFFFKREIELAPYTALSGMALGAFGIYIINNGLITSQNWFTNYFSYILMAIGFGFALWSLIEWIQDMI